MSVFKNLLSSPTQIKWGESRASVTDRCGQLLQAIITSGGMTPPALSSDRGSLTSALSEAFKGDGGFGHIGKLGVACQQEGQAGDESRLIRQMTEETIQKASPVVGMLALAIAVIPVNDEVPSESALRISAGETVQYTDQTRMPATNVIPAGTGSGFAPSTAIETTRRGRWGDESPECLPSTPGKVVDKPSTAGEVVDQPSTPGKVVDQSSTSGKGGDKPSTAGKGGDKPSTSGMRTPHPSQQKVGFRPEDAFLGGDGIPDNVCPGASVAQVLTYALDQAVETCMSLQFITTSDTARPARPVRLVECEGGPEYLECDISMLYRPAALLLPGSESYYRNIVGGGTTVDWIQAIHAMEGEGILGEGLIDDAKGVPTDSKVLESRLECVRKLLNTMWSDDIAHVPLRERIAKLTLRSVVQSNASLSLPDGLVDALWNCVIAEDPITEEPPNMDMKHFPPEDGTPVPEEPVTTKRNRAIQEALMLDNTDYAVELIASCVAKKVRLEEKDSVLLMIVREVVKVMSDNMTWLRRMADYAIAWGPITHDAHTQLEDAWTRVATLKRMQKRVEKKTAGTDDEPGHSAAFINLSAVTGVIVSTAEGEWEPGAEAYNTGAGAYFCALLNNLGLKTIGDEARSADANPLAGGKNTAVLIGRTPDGRLIWQVYNTIKVGSTGGDYYYIFTNAVQGPSLPASFFKMHPDIFVRRGEEEYKPPWSWCPQWYSYNSDSGSVTIIRAPIENIVPALGTCTESSDDLAVPWVTSSMNIVKEVLEFHNKEGTTIGADYDASIQPLLNEINKLLQSGLHVVGDQQVISCETRAKVVAQVANALQPLKDMLKDVLGRVVGSDEPVSVDPGSLMREAQNMLTGICGTMVDPDWSREDKIGYVTGMVQRFMTDSQQCIAMAIALDEYVGILAPSMQTVYRMIGRLSSAISSRLPTGSKNYKQVTQHQTSKEAIEIFPEDIVAPALRQGYVHASHTAFEQAMVMAPLTSQVDVMCVMGNIARAWINRAEGGRADEITRAALGCDQQSGNQTPDGRGTSPAGPSSQQSYHSNWSDTSSAKGSPWNSPSYPPGSSPPPGNSPPHMGPLAAASPRSDGYTTPTYAGTPDGTMDGVTAYGMAPDNEAMVDVDSVAPGDEVADDGTRTPSMQIDDRTTHAGGGNGFLVTPMLTVPARTRRRNKRGRCRTLKQARK